MGENKKMIKLDAIQREIQLTFQLVKRETEMKAETAQHIKAAAISFYFLVNWGEPTNPKPICLALTKSVTECSTMQLPFLSCLNYK